MNAGWPCPGPGGPTEELAVTFDRQRRHRLLIVPPLFDEMNRTRRFLIETMRRLDIVGVDSVLPDLPGCNESVQAFEAQSLYSWRKAMAQAAAHFRASHVLAVRGGALVFPNALPGWVLEPVKGASLLRQMLRARTLAGREAGLAESSAELLEIGREEGLDLAGYRLGAALVAGLESAMPLDEGQREIRQSDLGGGALWLRAEPGEDPGQANALAAIIAEGIAA
ncbi:hypothetical protein [Novosphingobium cyanobacteriorum]|uniref:Uncharacterized protein n=1 Tax=Novosphingobium cyanobacteriorum TaxID=3024215 RepID=A0ABT6CIR7_9SPHN|nr:hypothetical protein [Novosphingobium cyanobacteriorum]MDF8332252.1 hypothetical protein [Novosphingobium cyanobacteriorum]